MNSMMKQQLLQQKRTLDILGVNYFTGTDNEISGYVASRLNGYKTNGYMATKTYQLQQALDLSVNDIMLFGEDYFTKVAEITESTQCVPAYNGSLNYACHVIYSFDDEKQEVITDSGIVHHYKTPIHISELAPIFLGHEHIHALKETNYQEYINAQRVGDVIPLFYELVITKRNYQEIYKKWLNARMFLMNDLKRQYTAARQISKNEFRDKDLYKVLAMRTGQYLNSFYYALILYHMYLDDENLILELVRKVLNHEMTTLDLLNTLGIYGKNNKKVFEKELDNLKMSL